MIQFVEVNINSFF